MKEPCASPGSAPVPAFLMKLWALLEDSSNSDVITWNWNGQNFCILDDQRFSKEILPKYFKHNNLSSFIRQLNMYGFRKVMSLEGGLVRSDRASAIEFQHNFFKKGQAELLEHIKRKISTSVKSEDPHLSQEELQKVLLELQELKDGQNNMDAKLENMRRENQVLWKEVSSLRRKHSQQQKLLTKILQFILSLMRGNIVVGPKRKRQLTLEPTTSPPPKYSRNILQFPEGGEEEVQLPSQHSGVSEDNALQIHEIFSPGEGTSGLITQDAAQTQIFTAQPAIPIAAEVTEDSVQEVIIDDSVLQLQSLAEQTLVPSSSTGEEELALDVVPPNSAEDDDSVINSILNENSAAGDYDLLYRDEIQDYLSCIDASLEELQSLLSRKNVEADFIDEPGVGQRRPSSLALTTNPNMLLGVMPATVSLAMSHGTCSSTTAGGKESSTPCSNVITLYWRYKDNPLTEPNTSLANEMQGSEEDAALQISDEHMDKGKQLMQYTGNSVLSLFDLPSIAYEADALDPTHLLTALGDDAYAGGLAAQNDSVPGCSSSKDPDLLVEDFSGPQEVSTLFVLSPVNKLIDEAKESEAL